MFELIPIDVAIDLLARVVEFRQRDSRPLPSQEAAALLSLFPSVRVRDGYILDFSQETSAAGIIQHIRPFVRPADDDSWLPIFDDEIHREDLVEELYQYFEFERNPQGVFEYAFFAIELWSLRLSRHAADWLESSPIFDAAAFDGVVSQAEKASEVKRPDYFGPQARLDKDGGARVRFLVHTPMGWERIYYLESLVFSDGFVEQEAGEIVADLGSGLVF